MLKAATGYSLRPDSGSAGKEAAEMAGRDLHDLKIVFVYCGGDHDLAALMTGAAAALPGTPIIGCTSCQGLILPVGFVGGVRFVGMLALADQEMTVGVGSAQYESRTAPEGGEDFSLGQLQFDDNPFKTAGTAAARAMAKAGQRRPPSFFFLAGLPGLEDLHLAGLAPVIGRAPFAGVSAADCRLGTDWALLTEDGPLYDGLALAFFTAAGRRSPVTSASDGRPAITAGSPK